MNYYLLMPLSKIWSDDGYTSKNYSFIDWLTFMKILMYAYNQPFHNSMTFLFQLETYNLFRKFHIANEVDLSSKEYSWPTFVAFNELSKKLRTWCRGYAAMDHNEKIEKIQNVMMYHHKYLLRSFPASCPPPNFFCAPEVHSWKHL